MPVLTLKFKGKTLKEFFPKTDAPMTIGRADDNDIVIPNMAVSGHQAKIDHADDDWLLTDLDSTNGTFVNDAAVSTCRLRHGDRINIVKHTLVFTYMKGEPRPRWDDQDTEFASLHVVGVLAWLKGGEGEILLDKDRFLIGKDPASDMVINGVGIAAVAAAVSRHGGHYLISHEGGLSRVKVNGKALKQPVRLQELDEIEIGPARLRFYIR